MAFFFHYYVTKYHKGSNSKNLSAVQFTVGRVRSYRAAPPGPLAQDLAG